VYGDDHAAGIGVDFCAGRGGREDGDVSVNQA
jgi:hypothetical protein